MDACVVSSTLLVHVGNNCIRVVAEISIMAQINFWHERYSPECMVIDISVVRPCMSQLGTDQ